MNKFEQVSSDGDQMSQMGGGGLGRVLGLMAGMGEACTVQRGPMHNW